MAFVLPSFAVYLRLKTAMIISSNNTHTDYPAVTWPPMRLGQGSRKVEWNVTALDDYVLPVLNIRLNHFPYHRPKIRGQLIVVALGSQIRILRAD